jgi:Rhodopirellula transposase DDE domain
VGLHEASQGILCVENFSGRGRPRSEQADPRLAADIRAFVEPFTQADPELKSSRLYTNVSAAEVRRALVEKGHDPLTLPSERTLRDILDRMNYRLKRIQKAKPLKKTAETDAIFANVKAVREESRADPTTLEISVDTKAKVAVCDYARGGKNQDRLRGEVRKGWDHDLPAKQKQVPFGILMLASGALTLLFGTKETSDAWADSLMEWWEPVRSGQGPEELRAADAVPEADGAVRGLVGAGGEAGVLPAVHSKYNPVERCWSALERKWRGVLLSSLGVILWCARRMTWKGRHPTVRNLLGKYRDGVRVPAKEMRLVEARLQRSATLPKYDITLEPSTAKLRV